MNNKYAFSADIRQALGPLYALNNWRGPLAVLEDYVIMAAAVALGLWHAWLIPLSVLVIGARQRALASVLHESCHMTLARHRGLNDFLGKWLAGMAIFQSHAAYRLSHVRNHHTFLGDPDRDPDYINCIDTGLYGVRDSRVFLRQFVLKTVLLGNVPSYLQYLVAHRLGSMLSNPREAFGLVLVQALLIGALTQVGGWSGYLVYWLLPYFTAFQIIGWLSEICEHYRLYERRHSRLEMTRNRFPAWWERLFIGMHGDNYHLTHHLFAGLPFWNLGRAHTIMQADPEYARLNSKRGGIVSAPGDRISVLREIVADIDLCSSAAFRPVQVGAGTDAANDALACERDA